MSKQEEQIAKLNTEAKATLARSEVHGIGVIAITRIPKGTRVYADKMPTVYDISYGSLGKLFSEVRKIILDRWPSIVNGSRFIYPDARLLSFMNHSSTPNYDPTTDTTLCDILEGQELFEDYRIMKNWEKVWPPHKNTWLIPVSSAK